MKKDISNREDIRKFINKFQQELMKDDEFNSIFSEYVQTDILRHIDRTVDFWEDILLQSDKYDGDIVDVHLDVNRLYRYQLEGAHFQRWLSLFEHVIVNSYSGPKADDLILKAKSIASVIWVRINNLEKQRLELNN